MSYSFREPEWPAVCECKYDEARDEMDREDCPFHCHLSEAPGPTLNGLRNGRGLRSPKLIQRPRLDLIRNLKQVVEKSSPNTSQGRTTGFIPVPVSYAGPADTFGLDIINVLLPPVLRGKSTTEVVIKVNGESANVVQVLIK